MQGRIVADRHLIRPRRLACRLVSAVPFAQRSDRCHDTPTLVQVLLRLGARRQGSDGLPLYYENIMHPPRPAAVPVASRGSPSRHDFLEHRDAVRAVPEGAGGPQVSPTPRAIPLALWPAVNEAEFKMLVDRDIVTVEQLAKRQEARHARRTEGTRRPRRRSWSSCRGAPPNTRTCCASATVASRRWKSRSEDAHKDRPSASRQRNSHHSTQLRRCRKAAPSDGEADFRPQDRQRCRDGDRHRARRPLEPGAGLQRRGRHPDDGAAHRGRRRACCSRSPIRTRWATATGSSATTGNFRYRARRRHRPASCSTDVSPSTASSTASLQAKGLEFGEQMRDFTTRMNKLAVRANNRVLDLDCDEGRARLMRMLPTRFTSTTKPDRRPRSSRRATNSSISRPAEGSLRVAAHRRDRPEVRRDPHQLLRRRRPDLRSRRLQKDRDDVSGRRRSST